MKCEICGKEFTPRNRTVTVCGMECSKAKHRAYMKEHAKKRYREEKLKRNDPVNYALEFRKRRLEAMEDESAKCLNCDWYEYDKMGSVCVNADSPNCTDFMMESDSCGAWERKRI